MPLSCSIWNGNFGSNREDDGGPLKLPHTRARAHAHTDRGSATVDTALDPPPPPPPIKRYYELNFNTCVVLAIVELVLYF